MIILRKFLNYDLYTKRVNLNIGKSPYTSTPYSKFISKIVFLLIIIYFVLSMIEILERKNLYSNKTTKKTYPRPNISLNANTFKFAFAVFDLFGNIITQQPQEQQYYVPYFYQYITKNQGGAPINITRNYFKIRNCTAKDFSNLDDEYIVFNELSSYSCIYDFYIEINGFYEEYQNILVLRMDFCNSSYPTYNNCKPIDDVKKKLQGGSLNMYILDHDVDMTNYNDPFIPYLKLITVNNMNIYNTFEETKYYKKVEVQTDQSFFSKSFTSEYNFQISEENYSYLRSNYLTATVDPVPAFYFLKIAVYDKVDTIIRSYDKVWNGISALGGIMKIIIGIGILCTQKFNENEESINLIRSRHLMNIRNYEETEEKKGTIDLSIKKIKNQYLANSNFNMSMSMNRSKNMFLNPFNKFDVQNRECNDDIEIEEKIRVPQIFDSIRKKTPEDFLNINQEKNSIMLNNDCIINQDKTHGYEKTFNQLNFYKIQENMKEFFEKTKKKRNEFQFNFFEKLYLILGFTKGESKTDIFRTAKSELDHFMDIEYIIEKLQEFQKLKELILNRQQLKIFNYLIPFNNPKLSIKKKTLQMEKQNEILEFFQYLHNGIELNEFSKLDLKLKRLMEKTFQKS